MRNKKGIVEPLVEAWAFITYILIIIIFFVVFSLGKGDVQVEKSISSSDFDYSVVLRNFLRTPYESGTVADFIAVVDVGTYRDLASGGEARIKQENYNKLTTVTMDFFNKQFKPEIIQQQILLSAQGVVGEWEIYIEDISTNSGITISNTGLAPGKQRQKYFLAPQTIPGYHTKNYNIELYAD